MANKDLYEELMKTYEFMLGSMPNRQQFKEALRQTLSEEDLQVILMIPFSGQMPMSRLEKKVAKKGITPEKLHEIVRRLVPEGFIASFILTPEAGKPGITYPTPAPLVDMKHEGRVVMRGDIVSLTELQVRKHEDDPMRQASAVYFNAMTEDAGRSIPTKTPYMRVIPYEGTLTDKPSYGRIEINAPIPDPREVLPLDILSEMLKKEPIIALAECYCRRTKHIIGEPCNHPMETCLYFDALALLQIEAGRARRITTEEALEVLHVSEEAGLVHNISNAVGRISSLCACCTCSCGAMKSLKMRGRNASGFSRFVAVYDSDRCTLCETCIGACPMEVVSRTDGQIKLDLSNCIGCGLCVSMCPEGALSMVLRAEQPKVPKDGRSLNRIITTEALVGLVKKKITGSY